MSTLWSCGYLWALNRVIMEAEREPRDSPRGEQSATHSPVAEGKGGKQRNLRNRSHKKKVTVA